MTRVHGSFPNPGVSGQSQETNENGSPLPSWDHCDHVSDGEASALCYDVFKFYDSFKYRSIPLNNGRVKLPIPFTNLPARIQLHVKFRLSMSFTETQSDTYYKPIFSVEKLIPYKMVHAWSIYLNVISLFYGTVTLITSFAF